MMEVHVMVMEVYGCMVAAWEASPPGTLTGVLVPSDMTNARSLVQPRPPAASIPTWPPPRGLTSPSPPRTSSSVPTLRPPQH